MNFGAAGRRRVVVRLSGQPRPAGGQSIGGRLPEPSLRIHDRGRVPIPDRQAHAIHRAAPDRCFPCWTAPTGSRSSRTPEMAAIRNRTGCGQFSATWRTTRSSAGFTRSACGSSTTFTKRLPISPVTKASQSRSVSREVCDDGRGIASKAIKSPQLNVHTTDQLKGVTKYK